MSEDKTPDFNEVVRAAQRMQEEMQRVQTALGAKVVEGSAGGGMVVAKANGRQQVLSIAIDKAIVNGEEIDMLQDLVVAAVNQALARAAELAQQEMSQVAGGLPIKIPGLT